MIRSKRSIPFRLPVLARVTAVAAIISAGNATSAHAAKPSVLFDTLPVVSCRDVTTEAFAKAHPNERLVEAQLEISSLIVAGDERQLLQYFYQITTPRRTLQVHDYQPRTVSGSDYASNIGIEKKQERTRSLGVAVTGAWEYFARITGSGDVGAKDSSSVHYELLPPQETVASSGTIHRGYGVYYKLKRMRQALLEGAKQFSVTFRAPKSWRADFVVVHCEARGIQRSVMAPLEEETVCGADDFIVGLYLEGDEAARSAAERLVAAARHLRRAAMAERDAIRKCSYPTVFHELGGALGTVQPRIAPTWLTQLIYLGAPQPLKETLDQLPDEVRQAAEQYLAARDALALLSEVAAESG